MWDHGTSPGWVEVIRCGRAASLVCVANEWPTCFLEHNCCRIQALLLQCIDVAAPKHYVGTLNSSLINVFAHKCCKQHLKLQEYAVRGAHSKPSEVNSLANDSTECFSPQNVTLLTNLYHQDTCIPCRRQHQGGTGPTSLLLHHCDPVTQQLLKCQWSWFAIYWCNSGAICEPHAVYMHSKGKI